MERLQKNFSQITFHIFRLSKNFTFFKFHFTLRGKICPLKPQITSGAKEP